MTDNPHKKNGKRFYDKRLDKDYSYAQRRLAKMGVNDDIEKDMVAELERDNRYLKRKIKSIGITLGIAIRELEKNGYSFNFPGKKRENKQDNFDGDRVHRQINRGMAPPNQQMFQQPVEYDETDDLPF